MTQIFVFTAGNPEAREHLVASIENPIADDKVFRTFAEADHPALREIRDKAGGFYAWGATLGPRILLP